MRVVVATDMEGAAGIDRVEQCFPHHPEAFEAGRQSLIEDVNAVIRGLRRAGAAEVKVVEGHAWGQFRALASGDLEGRPEVLRGRASMAGLLRWAQAVAMVGYHAMAGTPDGFLSHTVTGSTALHLDGEAVGEMVMTAAAFGKAGIPAVLVTGDHATVREAAHFLPWAVGVSVKRAGTMSTVALVARETATDALEAGAAQGLTRAADCPPYSVPEPVRVKVQFRSSNMADAAMALPLVRRFDERTVAFDAPTVEDALKFFGSAVQLMTAMVRQPSLMAQLDRLPDVPRIQGQWMDAILRQWLDSPDTFTAHASAFRAPDPPRS
jgi:D-amino peptidase